MDEKLIPSMGNFKGSGQPDLPQPISSTSNISPLRRRLQIVRRTVIFGLLASLSFKTLSQLSSSASNEISQEEWDQPIEAYFGAITAKGMRAALWNKSYKPEDKHHDHEYSPDHGAYDFKEAKSHGYSPHGGKHKMRWISPKMAEGIFLSVPNNDSCRAASHRYTSYAHPAGSGYDFLSAVNLKGEWERELGIPASAPEENVYDAGSPESQSRVKNGMGKLGVWVDTYYPVMNTPVSSSVTLLTDPPFEAKLREDIVEGDPDSILRDEVRVFHGLSVSGDVTGKYVYVGYGQKSDFDLLQEKGIDFTGKIAIVKYGKVFRGLKVKAAEEAGAVGCIIYSDPGDDGEMTEENGYKQYPDGPARQPSSVQRGSVQYLSIYPGDPTTPGEPAYRNATRLEGGNQPGIPSLPISYEDAIPILKALKGKGIAASDLGAEWGGGLGFYGVEYFTGPSDVDLHFVNEVNTRVMPIWNTMATIPGHITDEVILLGNHRDAWVLGGSDPNSGTASQFELIRGLGELIRKGWKPLRTIVLASWDAEEYGLIGSTEWAEDFGSWLVANSAAYLNLDSSVAGSNFGAAASPSLAFLLRGAAEDVLSASDSSRSVWDTREDGGDWKTWKLETLGIADDDVESIAERGGSGVSALGSGSDFTAFLQRYGVASGNIGYGTGPKDATYHYHSIYDSFTWQDKFADKGFHKHTDIAKILGLILLRLSDSLILPLNTTQYARDLSYYLTKVEHIAETLDLSGEVDFEPLSKAISAVIKASIKLDEEKHEALSKLHKLLPKPKHHHFKYRIFSKIHRGWRKIRSSIGLKKGSCHDNSLNRMEMYDQSELGERLIEFSKQHEVHSTSSTLKMSRMPKPRWPHLPSPKRIKEIKAVLRKIRAINLKLKAFESGFISEEGIKDREWYKHKGTAPGIWLGYGATTFPALTEALTIDKSPELAQKESNELAEMIKAMAGRLED